MYIWVSEEWRAAHHVDAARRPSSSSTPHNVICTAAPLQRVARQVRRARGLQHRSAHRQRAQEPRAGPAPSARARALACACVWLCVCLFVCLPRASRSRAGVRGGLLGRAAPPIHPVPTKARRTAPHPTLARTPRPRPCACGRTGKAGALGRRQAGSVLPGTNARAHKHTVLPEPSRPGADVGGGAPGPGADVGGVSPFSPRLGPTARRYARTLKPQLTEEAKVYLKKAYHKLRQVGAAQRRPSACGGSPRLFLRRALPTSASGLVCVCARTDWAHPCPHLRRD
jgi:hypothetical protein